MGGWVGGGWVAGAGLCGEDGKLGEEGFEAIMRAQARDHARAPYSAADSFTPALGFVFVTVFVHRPVLPTPGRGALAAYIATSAAPRDACTVMRACTRACTRARARTRTRRHKRAGTQ